MKTIIKSTLSLLALMPFMWSCQVDEIEDIEQDIPVVAWDRYEYNATLILTNEVNEVPEVKLHLFGSKVEKDVSVTVALNGQETTAKEGVEFTLDATQFTIEEGSHYVTVPYSVDIDKLEQDVEKVIAFDVVSVGAGLRKTVDPVKILVTKRIVDVKKWAGAYKFDADTWDRESSVAAVDGEPYKIILHNFWGNDMDMEGTIDTTDPYHPKVVVPAGTLLSEGWDEQGKWFLKNDLIAEMVNETMTLNFIQFDYVCEGGAEGSFPYCGAYCRMEKK